MSTTALHEEHHPDESITRRALSHRTRTSSAQHCRTRTSPAHDEIIRTARASPTPRAPHQTRVSTALHDDDHITLHEENNFFHTTQQEHQPASTTLDENHRASDENITGTARREHQQHRKLR